MNHSFTKRETSWDFLRKISVIYELNESAVNVQITAGRLEKDFLFFRHFHSSVLTVVFASSAKTKHVWRPWFQQTECKPDQTTNENTKDVKTIISMRDTVVTSPPSSLLFKPFYFVYVERRALHLCKQQIQSCVSHDLEFWSCDNALIEAQRTSSEAVKSYTRSYFQTFCPVLLVDFVFRRFILISTIT